MRQSRAEGRVSFSAGATRAVRPPMTVVVVPFSSPPVMVVIIPIRLRAAIAAMPVNEISVQCVRPALFPIGVATMNLQNECTLSRPACPWNVQSGVGVLAAHQTDRNKTNGCNDNHTSQKALASIVDLDKLLSAVMTRSMPSYRIVIWQGRDRASYVGGPRRVLGTARFES